MSKCGKTEEHCCWLFGEVCQYLERNPEGSEYIWSCGLRKMANSWDEVYEMDQYKMNVKPKIEQMGYPDIGCGDWPPAGKKCNDCGEVG